MKYGREEKPILFLKTQKGIWYLVATAWKKV
jgi:hypothetical protein